MYMHTYMYLHTCICTNMYSPASIFCFSDLIFSSFLFTLCNLTPPGVLERERERERADKSNLTLLSILLAELTQSHLVSLTCPSDLPLPW